MVVVVLALAWPLLLSISTWAGRVPKQHLLMLCSYCGMNA